MDGLETQMEQCNFRKKVILIVRLIPFEKLLDFLGNQHGLCRLSLSTGDVDWNAAVHPSMLDVSSQNQEMNLLDNPFGKRLFVLHESGDEVESVFMSDDVEMVFQRLLVDSQPTQDEIRFMESKSVTLYGIGVVSVFDGELVV